MTRQTGSGEGSTEDTVDRLVAELRELAPALPSRSESSPADIEAGVGQLVLTLVEFIRQVLEHQAVGRMEGGSLDEQEIERLGVALMRLEENERLARELRELNEELEDRIRLATLELEERNRRLEWQSRELEKASRLKSEFLASMSHELRTPINAVLGYTSLMIEEIYGELSDKQRNALDKINTASQHLLDLINDILDLSKIEAGKMPVYLEEVPLRQVLGELAESVDPLVREKRLQFELEVDENVTPLVTDRTKLKQILLNLLSNAVKFTAAGTVSLRAECAGADRVLITVADTGIGIKEEDLQQIFEDFRQVDQSPTREYGGTGLGLSITRKLISLLAGTIEVESRYGGGSRFAIELPVRLDRAATVRATDLQGRPAQAG